MKRPNVLILMCDQLQGRVFEPGHPCRTPNLDAWAAGGTRLAKAYTPNAVCSPARASLMTGLLPHNHGVLQVTHTTDSDQNVLRTDKPHWAQVLQRAGYRTGYYGKWHVERTDELSRYGWEQYALPGSPAYKARQQALADGRQEGRLMEYRLEEPEGYRSELLYGVTRKPPEQRGMGVAVSLAEDFLESAFASEQPWCCMVSVLEPHDPFVCGEEAFLQYNPEELELPPNFHDRLEDRPGLYRKSARAYKSMTQRQKKEAMACYYASITEIDSQFGRLIRMLQEAGKEQDTIVVLTSDHGELLGAHGLYTKNISAFEEVYHIPMMVTGPGIAQGVTDARVGLHDLCPTLLELTGCEPFPTDGSRSFAELLRNPGLAGEYQSGYAEYHGGRALLTQRVTWEGPWKYVFNGFDEDELYNLEEDPGELCNRIADSSCDDALRRLSARMWEMIKQSGDHSLLNAHYASLRLASYGPEALGDKEV